MNIQYTTYTIQFIIKYKYLNVCYLYLEIKLKLFDMFYIMLVKLLFVLYRYAYLVF